MRKKQNEGFTLVELIVVLVILGILMAILVPSLTGWIVKAKNQDAIMECRSVVMAAQGQVAEIYGKTGMDDAEMNLLINQSYDDIRELADVEGTISSSSIVVKSLIVSNLTYLTKSGVKVVYTREGKPPYVIDAESKYADNVPGYNAQVSDIFKNTAAWNESHFLNEDGKTVNDKYTEYFNGDWEVKKNNTKRLQLAYLEKYGSFPVVDKSKIILPEGISWQNPNEELAWKPVMTSEGEIIMVADSRTTMTNSQPYASIVYHDGTYYYHRVNDASNKVNGTSVDYVVFTINSLTEQNNWIEFPNS